MRLCESTRGLLAVFDGIDCQRPGPWGDTRPLTSLWGQSPLLRPALRAHGAPKTFVTQCASGFSTASVADARHRGALKQFAGLVEGLRGDLASRVGGWHSSILASLPASARADNPICEYSDL
jgi:hypothetical protein